MTKRQKTAKQDFSQSASGFSNHAFAQLKDQLNESKIELADAASSVEINTQALDAAPRPVATAYHVRKTRKGGWPLRTENRAGNKTITVLEGVSGDSKELLVQLKKYCGAGGTVRDDVIELQGDQRARIETFLQRL